MKKLTSYHYILIAAIILFLFSIVVQTIEHFSLGLSMSCVVFIMLGINAFIEIRKKKKQNNSL